MNLKNKIRLFLLRKANSNLIITQHWQILDQSGKCVYKNSKVSDSLVGNFMQYLWAHFSNGVSVNWAVSGYYAPFGHNYAITGTTNTNINLTSTYPYMVANAGVLDAGMIYGQGTTAPTAQDHIIQTQIAEGVGANQLNYNVMQGVVAPSSSGADTTFRLQRLATNNSGSDVPVSEVALYMNTGGGTTSQFMIYRDLFLPTVTIPNLQSLNTIIEFKITT